MLSVFEWDSDKARLNLKKHGVSFAAEAMTVFGDPLARIFDDPTHSKEEAREIIVGYSKPNQLLLICFIEPGRGRIRIISARRATKREQYDYEEHVTN